MHGTGKAAAPDRGCDNRQPKAVRIAVVCEREIAALSRRIDLSVDDDERTALLRARADIRKLLAYATSQDEYAVWARSMHNPAGNADQEHTQKDSGLMHPVRPVRFG